MPDGEKPPMVVRSYTTDKELDDRLSEFAWQQRSNKSAEIRKALAKHLNEPQEAKQ